MLVITNVYWLASAWFMLLDINVYWLASGGMLMFTGWRVVHVGGYKCLLAGEWCMLVAKMFTGWQVVAC